MCKKGETGLPAAHGKGSASLQQFQDWLFKISLVVWVFIFGEAVKSSLELMSRAPCVCLLSESSVSEALCLQHA